MALNPPESAPRAFREISPGIRVTLVVLLSVVLMVLDHRNDTLREVRRLLTAATYPLQVLVSAPFTFARWLDESFISGEDLALENQVLRERMLVLSGRLQRQSALEAENERLRALLDSTGKLRDRLVIAEIVSVDMNPYRQSILINKGSRDGAYVGQALIDADGVVGQITRDRVFSAEAILITDADHALPVELVRNRLRTIAVGTGDMSRLSLPFLPHNADVRSGDLLVTSGLGGTFPAGYPVGVVREVAGEIGANFLTVNAEPSAALNRIREVLLIFRQETGEAGPDEAGLPLEAMSAPDPEALR